MKQVLLIFASGAILVHGPVPHNRLTLAESIPGKSFDYTKREFFKVGETRKYDIFEEV